MNWFPLNREMTCRIGVLKRGGPVHLFVILITMITMITMMMMMMMMMMMKMMMMMMMMMMMVMMMNGSWWISKKRMVLNHQNMVAMEHWLIVMRTLLRTDISPPNGTSEGDFPFPTAENGLVLVPRRVFGNQLYSNWRFMTTSPTSQPVASTIPISLALLELW